MTQRLFLALPVYPSFKPEFDRFFERYRKPEDGYKWTPCNSLHITLHFFGETQVDEKQRILEVMPDLFRRQAPVAVKLDGLDSFPDSAQPRIIFADVHPECLQALEPLQKKVIGVLSEAGFEVSPRKYRPHVTLCRIKRHHEENWKSEGWYFESTETAVISRAVLYQSLLKPEGAVHLEDTVWNLEGL